LYDFRVPGAGPCVPLQDPLHLDSLAQFIYR